MITFILRYIVLCLVSVGYLLAVDLQISVRDSTSAVIPGATITLRFSGGKAAQSRMTNEAGEASFAHLPTGQATVEVRMSSFATVTRNIDLQGTSATLVVDLRPNDVATTVTVSDPAYSVEAAPQGTRTNLSLLDTPRQTNTVTRKLMDDRAVVEVKDAVANVPGVYPTGTHGGQVSQFILRGFSDYNNIFRDGVRQVGTYYANETADIQNVEVLKGPAASLYGFGQPGGIINLVGKQPESDTHGSVSFQTGAFDFYRPMFDLTGPLNRRKTLLYRFNAAYLSRHSFRDYVKEARVFVAPSIEYILGNNTRLFFDFSYLRDNLPFDVGLPALGNRPAPLPRSFTLYGPGPLNKQTSYRGSLRAEHQFSSQTSIRSTFSGFDNFSIRNRGFAGGDYNPISQTVPIGFYDMTVYGYRTYLSQTDFLTRFSTGFIRHDIFAGGEYYTQGGPPFTGGYTTLPPVLVSPITYPTLPSYLPISSSSASSFKMGGFYVQDMITLSRRWKIEIGGRQNIYRNRSANTLTGDITRREMEAFSPRVAILFQPTSTVSLYANWSRSFNPNNGISFDGQAFDPELGKAWEAGVKSYLPRRLGTVTAAFFDITKNNVLTSDLAHPGYSILTGQQRSKGAELDYSGQPLPGWNLLVGYAWTQAAITRDNTTPVGNSLLNVPRHGLNAWSTYQFQNRLLRNLSFGVGLFTVTSRFGDLRNTVLLPGYARVDASASYDIYQKDKLRYRLSLNISNALDRQYFLTAQLRNAIFPGDPRTIMGTWKVMF